MIKRFTGWILVGVFVLWIVGIVDDDVATQRSDGPENALDSRSDRLTVLVKHDVGKTRYPLPKEKPQRIASSPLTAETVEVASAPVKIVSNLAVETLYVSSDGLYLREKPSQTAAHIQLYPYSTAVRVLGRADSWVRVRVNRDNRKGWMHGDYLTSLLPNSTTTPRTVIKPSIPTLSDEEVAQRLIRDSISQYSGSCPCPYNYDRGGRRCGKRSAYSRPGGRSPLCYTRDVSKNMIASYRSRN